MGGARAWGRARVAIALLAAVVGCGPLRELPADGPVDVAALARHRAELYALAMERAERAPDGLAGFAAFAQDAADRAVLRVGRAAAPRAFLDDLVDLSLGSERPFAQRLLMVSPPLWRGAPLHESAFGTAGFAPGFRAGEGRVRHFVLAAAGTWAFPPAWVEAVGRWIGGDWLPEPGTDGAADVRTNAVGRDFGRWLRTVEPAVFADGSSVAAWIRARFGEGVR